MINPPLLLVSALFFLAVSALLYVGAWLFVETVLRTLPNLSAHRARRLLTVALLLPPMIAGAFTAGGAFLRHSHALEALHHNVYCDEIARFLAIPEGRLPVPVGLAIQGAAWLLLAWGALTVFRLEQATITLQRDLSQYIRQPSEKLAAAVSCIRGYANCAKLEFCEADIPMALSCLIGITRVRCILSSQLVSLATHEELEAVVLHEVNHFRYGDVWLTFGVGLLNCLFSCILPVRLLSRRWREETELACDAATTRATGQPLALASAILRAQGVPVNGLRLSTTTVGFAEETVCSTEKRVERLLAYAQGTHVMQESPSIGARQWTTTVILFVMGLSLLLSPDAMCIAHCSLEAVSRVLH